jgi:hypothetical protein
MNQLTYFKGLIWLLITIVILVILQRKLHREIQAFFLILTRRNDVTQFIFSFIFLPGVFLHELSHFLMAKLMGVETGKFSLIPNAQPNGKVRLGYVETVSGGFLRDALIGVAPLVTGCLFVAYATINQMQLFLLWNYFHLAEWTRFWSQLISVPRTPDFWLWFYLVFSVSSTMMPSASDRHAWLPVGILAVSLLGIAVFFGAGKWVLENLALPLNKILLAMAMIFTLSSLLHALLILPFMILHRILTRWTGLEIS